uniref:ATP synthase CF1 epsilon subunit n=1 Tax=Euphronia guianensis TaxID=82261 RepID=A0A1C8QFE4_9ROSI|nr:ATP synthase CF1 epsilon subunit [Euphronia guianensis]
MTFNLCVLTPTRILWDSEVNEIILATKSGKMGVLPNHVGIVTILDIGVLRIRLNDQWVTIALMGGYARISNNKILILADGGEKGSDIDAQEARQTFEIAKANLEKAEGTIEIIEAKQALRQAKARVEAITAIS